MLIPSTITARRTRRYTSTWYIHPTAHKHDFEPMDGRGRYIFQPPQCQAANPSRWSTLPPPFTFSPIYVMAMPRGLAGKPLAGFRATPDRRIIVLCGMIVSVIRFKNPLLHRQSSLRKRQLGENRGFRPSF